MNLTLPWRRPKDNYFFLAAFILASELTGILGSIFTISSIPTWYSTLNKPFFSPPNWIFGPVWTLLYALIGLSAYLIWRKYKFGKKGKAFWQAFAIQLSLNFFWTPLFFGLHLVGLAFAEILIMWFFIFRTIREGKRLVPWSGYLLYPYLAWVSFAALLNLAILMLN